MNVNNQLIVSGAYYARFDHTIKRIKKNSNSITTLLKRQKAREFKGKNAHTLKETAEENKRKENVRSTAVVTVAAVAGSSSSISTTNNNHTQQTKKKGTIKNEEEEETTQHTTNKLNKYRGKQIEFDADLRVVYNGSSYNKVEICSICYLKRRKEQRRNNSACERREYIIVI